MSTPPEPHAGPTATTLVAASLAAVALAAVALVTVILPAEYGIDPSGVGERLGLTALAESSVAAAPDAQAPADTDRAPHRVELTVPSGEGIEYKFRMARHAKMTYGWQTGGQPLYLDLHGEPEGDTTGYFESYVEANANGMSGSFTAPFGGSHGWYWRNDTDDDVTVLLTVEGRFDVIGLK